METPFGEVKRIKHTVILSAAAIAVCAFAVFFASGCGGGGSSSSGTTYYTTYSGMTVSGAVQVPSQVSMRGVDPAIARAVQAPFGLATVDNVSVSAYRITDDGAMYGATITWSRTNDMGIFAFSLPYGTTASATLVLSVGSGADRMRAFVTSGSVDINPFTELVVQKVADGAHELDNFTTSELTTILSGVTANGASANFSSYANIADACAGIYTGALKTSLDSAIDAAK